MTSYLFIFFFSYLAQMLSGWNLTVENSTFSSILIRWTNLTNVLNRKVRHYIVFLNRRNNSVKLHQVLDGEQLTTAINGLVHSTNYSVEVVGIDTMGKPYKTPSEATMTANRKRGNAAAFLLVLRKVLKLAAFNFLRDKNTLGKKVLKIGQKIEWGPGAYQVGA